MSNAAIELEVWHAFLAAGIFSITVGIPLWRQYKATLAKERAAGAAEQREHDAIHGKLRAGEQRFSTVDERLMDVESGIKQLHNDHKGVSERLKKIEQHIAARNGSERKTADALEEILDAVRKE